ncbi:MAG: DUF2059 domain-containing protein [Erythrobacter sp.]|nr:DUF2059 domain-containing protein [Erythrobacter sp.]NCQ63216.1 DUF2059 domain-containing protein [Alphaproteobacteria bacterium]
MKTMAFATALVSLALTQPAFAQDETGGLEVAATDFGEADMDDESATTEETGADAMAMVAALIGGLFQADPLTPEAEARLPLATEVAGSLVPEGVYGEMMGQMMDSFLSPIMEMAEADGGSMSASDLTAYTGLYSEDLDALSDEERGELTEIFDPVYETRTQAQFDMIVGAANAVFATLEPGVRDGLAKAYASRFDASELAALNAFFATPVGAKYASQSLVINTDPQVISGMMQSIPNLLEQLPALMEGIEDAEAGLPEPRRYEDLTPAEQRRASELLGVDQQALRESMAQAEEMEAAADAVGEAAAEVEEAWDMDMEAEEADDVEGDEADQSFEEAMEDVGN